MQHVVEHCFGFLFAFKAYSQAGGSLMEMLVSVFSASDLIHVAILPVIGHVTDCDGNTELCIADPAYTAFMGIGFSEHSANVCIDSSFVLVYVPAPATTTMQGIQYLRSLRGKGYNYAALPVATMPQCCRRGPPTKFDPDLVICSQIGMLLCYR